MYKWPGHPVLEWCGDKVCQENGLRYPCIGFLDRCSLCLGQHKMICSTYKLPFFLTLEDGLVVQNTYQVKHTVKRRFILFGDSSLPVVAAWGQAPQELLKSSG